MANLQLNSSDIFHLYKPSRCERRLYLMAFPPQPLDTQALHPLQSVDQQLHRHLLKAQGWKDLSEGPLNTRLRHSMKAWFNQEPFLYKPIFKWTWHMSEQVCELLLEPDFMIYTENGYLLRLVRNAHRISRENHADALFTMQYQGWLYEKIFGTAPQRLEIYHAQGNILEVPPADPGLLEQALIDLLHLKTAQEMPYSPISWTKCQACLFRSVCWSWAEKNQDLALLPNLHAKLLLALREAGAQTISDLLEHFPEEKLAQFVWYEGTACRKLGPEKAKAMRQMAEVILSGQPKLLQPVQLPMTRHWALFDLEGVPAQWGHTERIYLWGLSLMGPRGEENLQTLSPDLSKKSDQKAWRQFLSKARQILEVHGDIPFLHWGNYEAQSLSLYLKRYGDDQGIGQRIQKNLLDLWALLKASILIPLPSYSLKVIEEYVGFQRPDKDTGGYWSVMSYLKSTSTRNHKQRERLQQKLLAYNHADRLAMWYVLQWFQEFLAKQTDSHQ